MSPCAEPLRPRPRNLMVLPGDAQPQYSIGSTTAALIECFFNIGDTVVCRSAQFVAPHKPMSVATPTTALALALQLLEAHRLDWVVHNDWIIPNGVLPALCATWHVAANGAGATVRRSVRMTMRFCFDVAFL
jgi:hypothetical protein